MGDNHIKTRSPEWRRKISESLIGKKRPDMTGENNPSKRLEVREKISKALMGKKSSLEHRLNTSKGHLGIKYPNRIVSPEEERRSEKPIRGEKIGGHGGAEFPSSPMESSGRTP